MLSKENWITMQWRETKHYTARKNTNHGNTRGPYLVEDILLNTKTEYPDLKTIAEAINTTRNNLSTALITKCKVQKRYKITRIIQDNIDDTGGQDDTERS